MKNFGKFTTLILSLIISPIIRGFVLVKLWGWFIVTTFSISAINMPEAIGMMMIIGYIIIKPEKTTKDSDFWDDFFLRLVFIIITSLFALLSGYTVSQFI